MGSSFLKVYHGFKWKRIRGDQKPKSEPQEVKPISHSCGGAESSEEWYHDNAVQYQSQGSWCDLPEFDPEKDYAEVLKEAKSHFNYTGQATEDKTSWLDATSECQLDAYKQLEARLRSPKSSKSWKIFLFWKRHSEESQGDLNNMFAISQQNNVRHNRRNVKSSYSANLDCTNNTSKLKQSKVNSGPLYTDGLPCEPSNIRQRRTTHSGLLGTFLAFSTGFKEINASPYAPLHCPPPQSPLYCC